VTIAGADGAEVPEASDTYANLLAAMRSSGDPQVSLRVRSYRKRLFRLTARITRHPDWLAERVMHDARDALVSRFGFSARSFGQRVALSEVMAVIQTVSGVVGVDVDAIFRTDLIGGNGLLAPLPSAVPAVGSGSQTEPAELLLIDEAGVQIVVE